MLLEEAKNFIQTMYGELNYSNHIISKRITEIEKENNKRCGCTRYLYRTTFLRCTS